MAEFSDEKPHTPQEVPTNSSIEGLKETRELDDKKIRSSKKSRSRALWWLTFALLIAGLAWLSYWYSYLQYLIYFGSAVTVPLWLQTQQNYTAYWAGVAVAPIGLIAFFFSPLVGKYMQRIDPRLLVASSFFLFSMGFFYQSNFTTQISLHTVMLARFLQGFGVAIFFLPLVQLTLGGISKERYASASGLFNFFRTLIGAGFGTALTIQLWTRLEIIHHARLAESLTSYRQIVTQFYRTLNEHHPALIPDRVQRILDRLVEQQAYMLATNDLAWLGAWLFLLMIPFVFLCKPVRSSLVQKEVSH